MFNIDIHTARARLQANRSASANQPSHSDIQNCSKRGARILLLDTHPQTVRSFLSAAWERITGLIHRRNLSVAASATPFSLNRCREIRDSYFETMLRAQFWGAYKNASAKDMNSLESCQRDYRNAHERLRDDIFRKLETGQKTEGLPTPVKFVLAELNAHALMQFRGEYPPLFLSQMHGMAEKLKSILLQSFGIAESDIAGHRGSRDPQLMRLALDCFAKVRNVIPASMWPRILPAAKTTYCNAFHDFSVKLRKGIPENRFPDVCVAVFAHKQAMSVIAHTLPDPSGDAINPEDRPRRTIWTADMRTAALEFLGFTCKKDEQAYQARLLGSDKILTKSDVSVLRSVLSDAQRARASFGH